MEYIIGILGIAAVSAEKECVSIDEAAGKICAGSIIPYSPGLPFVCPGEELTEDIVRYIEMLRSDREKVIGVNDKGEILVGKEREKATSIRSSNMKTRSYCMNGRINLMCSLLNKQMK